MEETAYEQSIFAEDEIPVVYATFWQRFAAVIIDALVLLPVTLLNNYNRSHWNNFYLLVACVVIAILYKPLCEYKYSFTIGKKAMNIKIVDDNYQPITGKHALLRNVFHLASGAITFAGIIQAYLQHQTATTTVADSTARLFAYTQSPVFWLQIIIGVLYNADTIFLLSSPVNRSLHDRIGNTFVVKS